MDSCDFGLLVTSFDELNIWDQDLNHGFQTAFTQTRALNLIMVLKWLISNAIGIYKIILMIQPPEGKC
jgi:hypothetical protein